MIALSLHVTLWIVTHYVLPILLIGLPLVLIGGPLVLWALARYGGRSHREEAAELLELCLLSFETPAEKRYRELAEVETSDKRLDSALLEAMHSVRRVNRWYSRHKRSLPSVLDELMALWIIAHYHALRNEARWERTELSEYALAKIVDFPRRARAQ